MRASSSSSEVAVYESSKDVWRSFRGQCGTPLTYQSKRRAGEVHAYGGAMAHPERYEPTVHVYFSEHVGWFDTRDDCERFEHSSSG